MERLDKSNFERTAFLIIDMQKGAFTNKTPRFNTPQVVENINLVSAFCRNNDIPVIFIQHDGTANNDFIPGSNEWEILDELEFMSNDMAVSKSANDAFFKSELEENLRLKDIETLIFSGCATEFCVESTIQSAITKNFNIIILKDGHTTGERSHLSAREIINHYNITWEGMIPVHGTPRVISSKELIGRI